MDVGVRGAVGLARVVHEDREKLVVGDGVEGQQGIGEEVHVRLVGEDFSVGWGGEWNGFPLLSRFGPVANSGGR